MDAHGGTDAGVRSRDPEVQHCGGFSHEEEQALLLHGEADPVWIASKPEQPTCGAAWERLDAARPVGGSRRCGLWPDCGCLLWEGVRSARGALYSGEYDP